MMPEPVVTLAADATGALLLDVIARVKAGDFTARMPPDWTGVPGKVADGLNEVIIANQLLEQELARMSDVVGTQRQLSQRAALVGQSQGWSKGIGSVNTLIDALAGPIGQMRDVSGGVAVGDLSEQVSADVRGEMLALIGALEQHEQTCIVRQRGSPAALSRFVPCSVPRRDRDVKRQAAAAYVSARQGVVTLSRVRRAGSQGVVAGRSRTLGRGRSHEQRPIFT